MQNTTWNRARTGAGTLALAIGVGLAGCDEPLDELPPSGEEGTGDDLDLEGMEGLAGEPPSSSSEEPIDLTEAGESEDALSPYGWVFRGTLYYYAGYGPSSLSGYLSPTQATDILLEAPVTCAPYVRWAGARLYPYGGYRTLYFVEQVQTYGYYQAHYRIGFGYGYGASTIDALFLNVHGYPLNAGYGYCPIHVYTRYGLTVGY